MTTREENFCFFFSPCPIFHLHVGALFFAFVAAFNTPDVLSSGFFIFFRVEVSVMSLFKIHFSLGSSSLVIVRRLSSVGS